MAYRLRKFARRHRWPLATACAVMTITLAALGSVAWQAQRALQASERAQALGAFMVGVFDQAGSSVSGEVDMRDLLQLGIQRSEHELADQPLAQAELFRLIARLQLGLGDYRPAAELAQRQRGLLARLDHAPPGLRLQASTTAALAHAELGDATSCLQLLTPELPLAAATEHEQPLIVADLHRALGHCRSLKGPAMAARTHLQQANHLYQQADHAVGRVQVLSDMAELGSRGDPAAGVQGYRQALALLRRELGSRHPLGIDLQRKLCALERSRSRTREAEHACAEALALAVRGPRPPRNHRRTASTGRLARGPGATARGRSRLPPQPSLAVVALGRAACLGRARRQQSWHHPWEQGRTDDALDALDALDRAIATLAHLGIAGQGQDVRYNRAMVLQAEGRSTQALPELRALLRQSQHEAASSLRTARVLFKLGETEVAVGERAAGLAHLHQARTLMALSLPANHPQRLRTRLVLAGIGADAGEPEELAELRALSALPRDGIELRKLAWLAQAHLLRRQCRERQASNTRTELQELRTRMAAALPEGGEVVRAVGRLTAVCDQP